MSESQLLVKIDSAVKRALKVRLASEGRSLKSWVEEMAAGYLATPVVRLPTSQFVSDPVRPPVQRVAAPLASTPASPIPARPHPQAGGAPSFPPPTSTPAPPANDSAPSAVPQRRNHSFDSRNDFID